jgi:hypothetical protein
MSFFEVVLFTVDVVVSMYIQLEFVSFLHNMIPLKHKDNEDITEKSMIFESNEYVYFNFDLF